MARNHLINTVTFAGFTSYGLFGLAIIADAEPETSVAGATFFLVGAIVGLFNRLYIESSTSSAVEDYGLSNARLFHTPGFSGLAAVGGVVFTALLSVTANPTTSLEQLGMGLIDIFNIETYPFRLVIAAIFGLTPNLLLNRLAEQSNRLENDLQSTQGPDRAPDKTT